MRFFNAIFALPLIGAVVGSPIAVEQDKRLLGLGSNTGSDKFDVASALDEFKGQVVSHRHYSVGIQLSFSNLLSTHSRETAWTLLLLKAL